MLTYDAPIIPESDCLHRGVYVVDSHSNFSTVICVYDQSRHMYIGLNAKDMIVMSRHINHGGWARPVQYTGGTCGVVPLEPYTVVQDYIEGTEAKNAAKVTLSNWDLHVFLDEYEVAFIEGAFDRQKNGVLVPA